MDKKESREDYLEAILVLSNEGKSVRSVDVANHLSFSRASVSIAMKKLKAEHLIEIDSSGEIHLSKKGREVASKTFEKHKYLTSWFESIGVSEAKAEKIACEIEHSIDEDTFDKIKNRLNK